MASKLSPAFAYTVVYVKDVAKSVDFYAKAFGYSVRRLDLSHRYVCKAHKLESFVGYLVSTLWVRCLPISSSMGCLPILSWEYI